MRKQLQSHLWLAALAANFLALPGCGERGTSGQTGPQGKVVTFKTAEPAPDGFDGWDFVWKGPKRALNVDLEAAVLRPDGTLYSKQDFGGYPGASENIQSSFSAGFAGGDPKVFWHQPIRFRFRVARGMLVFTNSATNTFLFRFFKKDPNGEVDWRSPFQTIDAVRDP